MTSTAGLELNLPPQTSHVRTKAGAERGRTPSVREFVEDAIADIRMRLDHVRATGTLGTMWPWSGHGVAAFLSAVR